MSAGGGASRAGAAAGYPAAPNSRFILAVPAPLSDRPPDASGARSAPVTPFTPDKAQIAALPAFERLPLDRIELVTTAAQIERAIAVWAGAGALGFDTESKPTFVKGEVSDGPHVLQLATAERAWVIVLRDPGCRAAVAAWLGADTTTKVGFGLRDDLHRIRERLGAEPRGVVDLNHLFRSRGFRKDIGVKAAVAVLFGHRFAKSGKAGTSNWAAPRLSESQLLYAANDAWAALRVWDARDRLPPVVAADERLALRSSVRPYEGDPP